MQKEHRLQVHKEPPFLRYTFTRSPIHPKTPFAIQWKNRSLKRRRRVKRKPNIAVIIPNAITLLSLCCSLTGVRIAFEDRFEWAVSLVLISAFLDGMDGRIARLLKATSRFGAELDSFADLVSFGIAPSLIMYLYALHTLHEFGWCVALFFSVCMALRLARFNVQSIEESVPSWASRFGTGVPAPAAGILGLSPLIHHHAFPGISLFQKGAYVSITMLIVSGLMVSRIPTFLPKNIKISQSMAIPVTIVLFFAAASIYMFPWISLSFLCIGYLVSIPLSVLKFQRLKIEREKDSEKKNNEPA